MEKIVRLTNVGDCVDKEILSMEFILFALGSVEN